MSLSKEENPNTSGEIRVKLIVKNDPARDENIRIKSNSVSKNYGISTISAQMIASNNGLRISNIGDQRITSNVEVNSLASEVLSIDGMRGEDLIFISSGTRNPLAIGEVKTATASETREYSVEVSTEDPTSIDIYDFQSGHIVGTRSIASDNATTFQGLSLDFDGAVAGGDVYKVVASMNVDDASNLNNMLDTSLKDRQSGVGGYAEIFGNIVSNTGAEIQANQQTLESSEVAYQLAVDIKNEFTGVDLDTEAARLMEQQQAYQALARVLTTARELLDTLLRSM